MLKELAIVFVVGNHNGGYLNDTLQDIQYFEYNNYSVQITGDYCYSSCTMLLGLSDVCISENTIFGFHGPSNNGKPLSEEDFSTWSNIMAEHYKEPLKSWFLQKGRYKIRGYYRIKGQTLVSMGYKKC